MGAERSTQPCLDELAAVAFVEQRLEESERLRWSTHLDRCKDCRRLVAALAPPPQASRFSLERCLGRGGFGAVFAAWDSALERQVAIKLLDAADEGAEARIRREAQMLAQLSHPHVVAIFDVGRLDDQLFIAMERMGGGSLRQWLFTEPDPSDIAIAFADAADGLDAAHRVGIVHGDFKVDNVLRDAGGRVAVADFGLAATYASTISGDASAGGERSVIAGTPSYLAPELSRGQPKSPGTDQYAFGVAFGEALRGRGGRRLQQIVARTRAEDPERRFRSMGEVRDVIVRSERPRWTRMAGWGLALALTATVAAMYYAPAASPSSAALDPIRVARCDADGRGVVEATDPAWETRLQRAEQSLRKDADASVVEVLTDLADEAAARGWPCAQARAHFVAGAALASRRDPASAARMFGEAALLGESLDADALVVRGWRRAVDQSLVAGDLDAAHEQIRHAQAYGRRRGWSADLSATIEVGQGNLAHAEARYDEAIEHFERALAGGLDREDAARAHRALASTLLRIGRVDQAADHAERAHAEFDAVLPDGPDRLQLLDLLARIASQQGDHDAAVEHSTALVDALAAAGMGESLNAAVALNVRGVARTEQGDYDAARRDLDQARQRYELLVGADSPTTGNAWYALGHLEILAGQPRDALPHLERARPLAKRSGNAHFLGNVMFERCLALDALDDSEARSACGESLELLSSVLDPDDPQLAEVSALAVNQTR
ncbi:MAG: protein kinase [Myxococcota bacterium]